MQISPVVISRIRTVLFGLRLHRIMIMMIVAMNVRNTKLNMPCSHDKFMLSQK